VAPPSQPIDRAEVAASDAPPGGPPAWSLVVAALIACVIACVFFLIGRTARPVTSYELR
jgi:hypothetical protein